MAEDKMMASQLESMSNAELKLKLKMLRAQERDLEAAIATEEAIHATDRISEPASMLRLVSKDLELVELDAYHQCVKAELDSLTNLSRSTFMDPKIASIMLHLDAAAREAQQALEQAQEDLTAFTFDKDSPEGKALVQRVKALLEENKRLGGLLAAEEVATLDKQLSDAQADQEALEGNVKELTEFMTTVEEEIQGMHCVLFNLQRQAGLPLGVGPITMPDGDDINDMDDKEDALEAVVSGRNDESSTKAVNTVDDNDDTAATANKDDNAARDPIIAASEKTVATPDPTQAQPTAMQS
eukprot:TRINITY_DN7064_c0_g1_i1.p1 TRINITY_DN7064_c0_g1~~TRINITY_DN7064_c0_g1_i1.p1  ORF type:complete len:307 (+),score=95.77 TRINITY_DN7064_c0_g1_i1:30-923(+)